MKVAIFLGSKSDSETMKKAADEMGRKETFRGYAPEAGYDFLREAIVRHYADFGVTLSPSEVFVSVGAKTRRRKHCGYSRR